MDVKPTYEELLKKNQELEQEAARIRRTRHISPDPGHELAYLLEPILELGLPTDARVVLLNDQRVQTLQGGFEDIHVLRDLDERDRVVTARQGTSKS